jgi:ABC-type transport system involved in multi-copper enzyme maturation permease subunit
MSVERAEFTKFRSVASTGWSLLAAAVTTVVIGVLYARLGVTRPPADPAAFDSAATVLSGVQLAQIAVGTLGILMITGEYASGQIRTTLTAVPRRTRMVLAKAVVVAAVTFALSLVAVVVVFLIGQRVLAPVHLDVAPGAPGVLRALGGAALYLTVAALLGLGLGLLLRNTAGAISALFGLLFVPQLVVSLLPASIDGHVARFLPEPAGIAVTLDHPGSSSLGPWTGLAVFSLYAAVVLALGVWRLRRTDV